MAMAAVQDVVSAHLVLEATRLILPNKWASSVYKYDILRQWHSW